MGQLLVKQNTFAFQDSLMDQGDVASTGMARLADRLVKSLGMEDALRMCRENSWSGVQQIIQGRINSGSNT